MDGCASTAELADYLPRLPQPRVGPDGRADDIDRSHSVAVAGIAAALEKQTDEPVLRGAPRRDVLQHSATPYSAAVQRGATRWDAVPALRS